MNHTLWFVFSFRNTLQKVAVGQGLSHSRKFQTWVIRVPSLRNLVGSPHSALGATLSRGLCAEGV